MPQLIDQFLPLLIFGVVALVIARALLIVPFVIAFQ